MTKAERVQRMIEEAQLLLQEARELEKAKYFVFPVTVNGKSGYARILDEKEAESWWSDGCKEVYSSSSEALCKSFVQMNKWTLETSEIKEWENESPFRN